VTGSVGYLGKLGSVTDSSQRIKVVPFDDGISLA